MPVPNVAPPAYDLRISHPDLIRSYPSIDGEELSGVGVVLDLLRGPEAEAEDEAALHLPQVDEGAQRVAHVLDEVNPPDEGPLTITLSAEGGDRGGVAKKPTSLTE